MCARVCARVLRFSHGRRRVSRIGRVKVKNRLLGPLGGVPSASGWGRPLPKT